MTRPVRARINQQALQHNISLVKSRAANSQIMAVIKANAYGHGALAVAKVLSQADAFAVAGIEEAVQLREDGIDKPVVLLEGLFSRDELDAALHYRLQMVVHHDLQIRWLEEASPHRPVHLWLKIDTGMHRLGFSATAVDLARQRLSALPAVQQGSLSWMSHLACADAPWHPATDRQLEQFIALSHNHSAPRSLANSAAILTRPDCRFDWVRPGIMLYGASPMMPDVDTTTDLVPVMTLETRLITVQQRNKGEAIGYGQDWACPRDMLLGIAAVGYGDGYPRHAPAGTPVLVNGERVPLVGRVCMDMIFVDLSSQPSAHAGDPVILWGEGLPVEDVADQAGTISYELLCNVTPRVARIYC